MLTSKDQKDLVQLKKIVGSVSITLEKMLKHISYEQCRIAYNAVAVAFAPDIYSQVRRLILEPSRDGHVSPGRSFVKLLRFVGTSYLLIHGQKVRIPFSSPRKQ